MCDSFDMPMQTHMKILSIILVTAFSVPIFAADPAAATDPLATAKAFDKDGNGQINGAESQTLKEYFTTTAVIRSLDTNKNGVLEDDEITTLKEAFASAMNIKTFDTNKNGQFDDGEINAVNASLNKLKASSSVAGNPGSTGGDVAAPIGSASSLDPKPGPVRPMKTARTFDADDTNQIEGAEVQVIRNAFANTIDLKPFDLNKNGTLDDPEIAALNVRLGKPKPAKPAPKIKLPVAENKPEVTPENKPKDNKDGSSIGELALAEVRACDTNHDGKIAGLEDMNLRKAFVSNPKSWLYIYDENANKVLDTDEIAKINGILTPGDPAAAAKTQTPKGKGKAGANDGQIKL